MLAASYTRVGPADEVLEINEQPTPVAGDGEVRVRVAWSGVNPSDVKSRAGTRTKTLAFERIIPHSDGSGVIDQVGAGVDPARLGQRVWLWNAAWKRAHGTAAEHVVLPQSQAVALPDGVDLAAGACLGIPALTAWQAVAMEGGVQGQTVLVAGGAGAVGHYAIQMARLLGARHVISTVSNDAKAELARSAGAHQVLNYRRDDVVAACLAATGGVGVDRIVEVDAAANMALDQQVLRSGGRMAIYGSGAAEVPVQFFPAIVKNQHLDFFIVYEQTAEQRAAGLAQLTSWLSAGQLQHQIAARLPLQRMAEAHRLVETGAVIGNVVVQLSDAV